MSLENTTYAKKLNSLCRQDNTGKLLPVLSDCFVDDVSADLKFVALVAAQHGFGNIGLCFNSNMWISDKGVHVAKREVSDKTVAYCFFNRDAAKTMEKEVLSAALEAGFTVENGCLIWSDEEQGTSRSLKAKNRWGEPGF